MSDYVRVEFDPPRQRHERGKSWLLTSDVEDDLFLPKKHTELFVFDDKGRVEAVQVSRFIAEDRGLVAVEVQEETHNDIQPDAMSRKDWFVLGIAMALVASGRDPADERAKRVAGDALWTANERVNKVFRELRGEWP